MVYDAILAGGQTKPIYYAIHWLEIYQEIIMIYGLQSREIFHRCLYSGGPVCVPQYTNISL